MKRVTKASLGCAVFALAAAAAFGAEPGNVRIPPGKALVLKLESQQWQALAAACATTPFGTVFLKP